MAITIFGHKLSGKNKSIYSLPFTAYPKAFTLAETLITMTIIGVIAALVLPLTLANVNQQSWVKAKDNVEAKIDEATKQMNVDGNLPSGTSITTEAFADIFQKYVKVAKRCTSSNLTDCFVPTFKSPGGTVINTNTVTTGAKLGHSTYTTPTVGFRLVDGTNIILSFNPGCTPLDWYHTSSSSFSASNNSQSYTAGATTACLAMLYDINGNNGPNVTGKDIGELNAFVSPDDCIKVGNYCISSSDLTYGPIDTCTDTTWDSRLTANTSCANNYWAGAKKVCSELGLRLPTRAELDAIYNVYKSNAAVKSTMDASELSGGYYWSSDEAGASGARCRRLKGIGAGTDNKGTKLVPVRCLPK